MATVFVGIDFDDTIGPREATRSVLDFNGGPGAWGACFNWLREQLGAAGHTLEITIVTAKGSAREVVQEAALELSCDAYSVQTDYIKLQRQRDLLRKSSAFIEKLSNSEAIAKAKLAYLQQQQTRFGADLTILVDDSEDNVAAMNAVENFLGISAAGINGSIDRTYALFVDIAQQIFAHCRLDFNVPLASLLIETVKEAVAKASAAMGEDNTIFYVPPVTELRPSKSLTAVPPSSLKHFATESMVEAPGFAFKPRVETDSPFCASPGMPFFSLSSSLDTGSTVSASRYSRRSTNSTVEEIETLAPGKE